MTKNKFDSHMKVRCLALVTWVLLAICTKITGCNKNAEERINELTTEGVNSNENDQNSEQQKTSSRINTNVDSGSIVKDTNILLLGFDRSGKLPGRTDSIVIVRREAHSAEYGIISVPRDLWVDIPGESPGRINKVFRVGTKKYGRAGGAALIKSVVQNELGIEIDYIVTADFDGFVALVDLIGGVEVNVECPIRDYFVSTEHKSGYESLSIKSGKQIMNGKTALLFARSRHGRTDLDRTRRQQAVLRGIRNKTSTLQIIPKLTKIFEELEKYVSTDMSFGTIMKLSKSAVFAKSDSFHAVVINTPVVYQWRSPEGKSVLKLNKNLFDEAVEKLFDAPSMGVKTNPTCKPADAALNWRKKKKEKRL